MIRFHTADGTYAVPVEQAVAVRGGTDVRPLPSPAAGVAGVLDHGGEAVPVVDVLGPTAGAPVADGCHVLVVAPAAGPPIGVLVAEVTGLADVDDDGLGPAPHGQDDPLVAAVARFDDGVAFVLDVDALTHTLEETRS